MQSFGLVRSPVPSREWHSLHAVHVRFVATEVFRLEGPFDSGSVAEVADETGVGCNSR